MYYIMYKTCVPSKLTQEVMFRAFIPEVSSLYLGQETASSDRCQDSS